MNKILLLVTNIKKSANIIDVISFEIHEKEGIAPKAFVNIPSNQFIEEEAEYLNNIILKDNDTILFSGIIANILRRENITTLTITKAQLNNVIDEKTVDPDIVSLLYDNDNLEIPEIFSKLHVPYYDRGDRGDRGNESSSTISIIAENAAPIILDNKIIQDSLQIDKTINTSIKTINLEIICSWISKIDGEIDITSKISKKFQNGRINTLTPRSLEASWPHFGERISCSKLARPSKYYVGHSRLVPENTLHMQESAIYTPPINIGKDPPLRLKMAWYNHKFSICFGYEQYRKESIKIVIKNDKHCSNGITKDIKINLRSIQEYLENDYSSSFFQTDLGQKAYKYITKMVALYMASSMRDTVISFSMPYNPKINCSNWIIVEGQIAKISSLKFKNNQIMEIQALGFSNEKFRLFLKDVENIINPPEIQKQNPAEITSSDIIHDIVVENDGITQTQKLFSYLSSISKKINPNNYKNLINKFLNDNKTSITIITKPLKIKYCEYNVINLGEVTLNKI